MPFRYFAATLVVLLLAGAAAFAGPSGSAINARVQLTDSAAAAPLAEHLSRPLLFNDRMGTAQVAHLSEPLDVAAIDTITEYRAGDVAYWYEGQSIIVFLNDGAGVPADGLTHLGHISDDLDELADCRRDCPVILDPSIDAL